jgi:hypothetical protein
MNRNFLHERVKLLDSYSLFLVSNYFGFLCGRLPSEVLKHAMEEMRDCRWNSEYYTGVGEGSAHEDRYGGLDPWEVDIKAAEDHVHFLIDCMPEEDLRPAGRYLEYLLDDALLFGDRESERADRELGN